MRHEDVRFNLEIKEWLYISIIISSTFLVV